MELGEFETVSQPLTKEAKSAAKSDGIWVRWVFAHIALLYLAVLVGVVLGIASAVGFHVFGIVLAWLT